MRTHLALLSSLLLFGNAVFSQSASPALQPNSQPQADILMVQAVAAFSASPVTFVHLTGTAHAIAGSTDQSGTFTLDLNRDGESNLHVDVGMLTRTETTSSSHGAPACKWSGADGVQHAFS